MAKLTNYGHACFGLEFKGKHLLFDPFITGNELAASIDIDQIPADIILVTHGHGDHVADVERIAKRTGAKVFSNYEVANWFEQKGLQAHPMNHGGKWVHDGFTLKYVNAIHTSSLPDGSNGGDPGGFVVWKNDLCFYHAGDTALTMDMQLIPKTCPKLDFAILPIGDNFTMGYADAAMAAEFIQCDRIVGCHYDTFGYIRIDHDAARKAFSDKGKELLLPKIGATLEF